MSNQDRHINALLRERAGDPGDLVALQQAATRRQRLQVGLGTLAVLIIVLTSAALTQ